MRCFNGKNSQKYSLTAYQGQKVKILAHKKAHFGHFFHFLIFFRKFSNELNWNVFAVRMLDTILTQETIFKFLKSAQEHVIWPIKG